MLLQARRCQHASHQAGAAIDKQSRDNALIQDIELLSRRVLLEQLRRHLALSSQDDAILGQNSNSSSSMGDGFQGVLDLIETAFWREDGCLRRVSAIVSPDGSPYWKLEHSWLGPGSGPGPASAQTYSGIVSSRHSCKCPAEPESEMSSTRKGLLLVGSERKSAGGMEWDGRRREWEVVWRGCWLSQ